MDSAGTTSDEMIEFFQQEEHVPEHVPEHVTPQQYFGNCIDAVRAHWTDWQTARQAALAEEVGAEGSFGAEVRQREDELRKRLRRNQRRRRATRQRRRRQYEEEEETPSEEEEEPTVAPVQRRRRRPVRAAAAPAEIQPREVTAFPEEDADEQQQQQRPTILEDVEPALDRAFQQDMQSWKQDMEIVRERFQDLSPDIQQVILTSPALSVSARTYFAGDMSIDDYANQIFYDYQQRHRNYLRRLAVTESKIDQLDDTFQQMVQQALDNVCPLRNRPGEREQALQSLQEQWNDALRNILGQPYRRIATAVAPSMVSRMQQPVASGENVLPYIPQGPILAQRPLLPVAARIPVSPLRMPSGPPSPLQPPQVQQIRERGVSPMPIPPPPRISPQVTPLPSPTTLPAIIPPLQPVAPQVAPVAPPPERISPPQVSVPSPSSPGEVIQLLQQRLQRLRSERERMQQQQEERERQAQPPPQIVVPPQVQPPQIQQPPERVPSPTQPVPLAQAIRDRLAQVVAERSPVGTVIPSPPVQPVPLLQPPTIPTELPQRISPPPVLPTVSPTAAPPAPTDEEMERQYRLAEDLVRRMEQIVGDVWPRPVPTVPSAERIIGTTPLVPPTPVQPEELPTAPPAAPIVTLPPVQPLPVIPTVPPSAVPQQVPTPEIPPSVPEVISGAAIPLIDMSLDQFVQYTNAHDTYPVNRQIQFLHPRGNTITHELEGQVNPSSVAIPDQDMQRRLYLSSLPFRGRPNIFQQARFRPDPETVRDFMNELQTYWFKRYRPGPDAIQKGYDALRDEVRQWYGQGGNVVGTSLATTTILPESITTEAQQQQQQQGAVATAAVAAVPPNDVRRLATLPFLDDSQLFLNGLLHHMHERAGIRVMRVLSDNPRYVEWYNRHSGNPHMATFVCGAVRSTQTRGPHQYYIPDFSSLEYLLDPNRYVQTEEELMVLASESEGEEEEQEPTSPSSIGTDGSARRRRTTTTTSPHVNLITYVAVREADPPNDVLIGLIVLSPNNQHLAHRYGETEFMLEEHELTVRYPEDAERQTMTPQPPENIISREVWEQFEQSGGRNNTNNRINTYLESLEIVAWCANEEVLVQLSNRDAPMTLLIIDEFQRTDLYDNTHHYLGVDRNLHVHEFNEDNVVGFLSPTRAVRELLLLHALINHLKDGYYGVHAPNVLRTEWPPEKWGRYLSQTETTLRGFELRESRPEILYTNARDASILHGLAAMERGVRPPFVEAGEPILYRLDDYFTLTSPIVVFRTNENAYQYVITEDTTITPSIGQVGGMSRFEEVSRQGDVVPWDHWINMLTFYRPYPTAGDLATMLGLVSHWETEGTLLRNKVVDAQQIQTGRTAVPAIVLPSPAAIATTPETTTPDTATTPQQMLTPQQQQVPAMLPPVQPPPPPVPTTVPPPPLPVQFLPVPPTSMMEFVREEPLQAEAVPLPLFQYPAQLPQLETPRPIGVTPVATVPSVVLSTPSVSAGVMAPSAVQAEIVLPSISPLPASSAPQQAPMTIPPLQPQRTTPTVPTFRLRAPLPISTPPPSTVTSPAVTVPTVPAPPSFSVILPAHLAMPPPPPPPQLLPPVPQPTSQSTTPTASPLSTTPLSTIPSSMTQSVSSLFGELTPTSEIQSPFGESFAAEQLLPPLPGEDVTTTTSGDNDWRSLEEWEQRLATSPTISPSNVTATVNTAASVVLARASLSDLVLSDLTSSSSTVPIGTQVGYTYRYGNLMAHMMESQLVPPHGNYAARSLNQDQILSLYNGTHPQKSVMVNPSVLEAINRMHQQWINVQNTTQYARLETGLNLVRHVFAQTPICQRMMLSTLSSHPTIGMTTSPLISDLATTLSSIPTNDMLLYLQSLLCAMARMTGVRILRVGNNPEYVQWWQSFGKSHFTQQRVHQLCGALPRTAQTQSSPLTMTQYAITPSEAMETVLRDPHLVPSDDYRWSYVAIQEQPVSPATTPILSSPTQTISSSSFTTTTPSTSNGMTTTLSGQVLGFLTVRDLRAQIQQAPQTLYARFGLRLHAGSQRYKEGRNQLVHLELRPDEVLDGANSQLFLDDGQVNRLASSLILDTLCASQAYEADWDGSGQYVPVIVLDTYMDPHSQTSISTIMRDDYQIKQVSSTQQLRVISGHQIMNPLLILHALLDQINSGFYGVFAQLPLTVWPGEAMREAGTQHPEGTLLQSVPLMTTGAWYLNTERADMYHRMFAFERAFNDIGSLAPTIDLLSFAGGENLYQRYALTATTTTTTPSTTAISTGNNGSPTRARSTPSIYPSTPSHIEISEQRQAEQTIHRGSRLVANGASDDILSMYRPYPRIGDCFTFLAYIGYMMTNQQQ